MPFTAHLAKQGRELPSHVQREFEDDLRCGRLEHGFLRVRCESCRAEHLVAFSCKRRGFCPSCGAVKVIACIEDPAVIEKILTHLKGKAAPVPLSQLPTARAPPGPLG